MSNQDKRAICLMVIGKKYELQYQLIKEEVELYAHKCNASVVIVDKVPDPSFHRHLLSQKLLIPQKVLAYDLVLFLDLDIKISRNAPDIFDELSSDKFFGAVLDARGSAEFVQTWQHDRRIIEETDISYFTSRNFEVSDRLQGCINGGVFIFRPTKVVKMFEDYYFSNHDQGKFGSYEETPMAYFTQVNNVFQSLDPKYNLQILYQLKGTEQGQKIINSEKRIPKLLRKIYYKLYHCKFVPVKSYTLLADRLLEKCYFLHFAGKYPYNFKFKNGISS